MKKNQSTYSVEGLRKVDLMQLEKCRMKKAEYKQSIKKLKQ